MTTRNNLRHALFGASTVLALCAGAPAFAADAAEADAATRVEQVVVTATRTEKPADEVPVTASVIGAQQIEDQLAVDIKDLIKFEPGVSVRTAPARFNTALSGTGRDGNSSFNIRGLEGNRVLIQVDGVRVPDSFGFGAQSVGRGDYADLDMIKSVEIVRGPASALYGSDGLAGSVSFFTKDPEDFLKGGKTWAAQAKAGYASADESTYGSLLLAGVSGPWQGMVAYTRRDGSEQETQGSNNTSTAARTVANPQDVGSSSILAKVVFDPAEGHTLRLTYDHLEREVDSDILSARTATTLSVLTHDETDRDRFTFDYHYTGEGLIEDARLAIYYQDATTSQFTAEDRTTTDRTRLNTFDNEVWGVGGQARSRFTTGGLTHDVVYGGDWSLTRQEGIRGGTVPTPPDVFPTRAFPNTDYKLIGLFVQDEIGLLDGRISLFPALRYDWYDLDPEDDALYTGPAPEGSSDGQLSPKIGIVWNATETLKVFANIATGFKAPSPMQVNNAFSNPSQGYMSIPNPDLKPETSETAEVGLRWKSGPLSLQGSVYAGKYEDFISQEVVSGSFTVLDPAVYQFVNIGEVKLHGVEARADLQLDGGWTLIASASGGRGDATSSTGKAPLGSIDPVKVTAGASWREAGGRFGGQLSVIHVAGKDESRTGCTGCYVPDAFTTIDLTAYWNINDNVSLRGGVFNLTDETYWWWNDVRGVSAVSATLDAYTMPGRNVGISLTLKM